MTSQEGQGESNNQKTWKEEIKDELKKIERKVSEKGEALDNADRQNELLANQLANKIVNNIFLVANGKNNAQQAGGPTDLVKKAIREGRVIASTAPIYNIKADIDCPKMCDAACSFIANAALYEDFITININKIGDVPLVAPNEAYRAAATAIIDDISKSDPELAKVLQEVINTSYISEDGEILDFDKAKEIFNEEFDKAFETIYPEPDWWEDEWDEWKGIKDRKDAMQENANLFFEDAYDSTRVAEEIFQEGIFYVAQGTEPTPLTLSANNIFSVDFYERNQEIKNRKYDKDLVRKIASDWINLDNPLIEITEKIFEKRFKYRKIHTDVYDMAYDLFESGVLQSGYNLSDCWKVIENANRGIYGKNYDELVIEMIFWEAYNDYNNYYSEHDLGIIETIKAVGAATLMSPLYTAKGFFWGAEKLFDGLYLTSATICYPFYTLYDAIFDDDIAEDAYRTAAEFAERDAVGRGFEWLFNQPIIKDINDVANTPVQGVPR